MTLRHEDVADAAEYAMRIDDLPSREKARKRMATDAEFRAEVQNWEEALASFYDGVDPVYDGVDPVAPPAGIKRELDRRLYGEASSPLGRFLPWLAGGAVGAGLAAAIALAIVPAISTDDPTSTIIAEIANEGDEVRVLAAYDPSSASFRVSLVSGTPAAGRDFEFWAIAPDSAPVSLGLVTEGGVFQLPDGLVEGVAELTLAVSDEPEGGSLTGAPSNVLAAAPVISL